MFTLSESPAGFEGRFFDLAPSADPQTQSRGIFYLVENSERQLAPGMALKATAPSSEQPRDGVIVPREAIVRTAGAASVYVQIADDKFTRREIELSQPASAGWFVTRGVTARDKVVTTGAQELLSEERKEQ